MKRKQSKHNLLIRFWKSLGPGLITGASDDDPSGIATYSQAGARFGYSFLWTAIITYPLMIGVQKMCARIGLVTSLGLTAILKLHYPKPVLWVMLLFSAPAIILNIGADLAGMGAVGNMLLPSVPTSIFSLFFALLIVFLIIRLSYFKIASTLKWLCIVLFCYLIVPFFSHPDFKEVFTHTLIPEFRFDKEFLLTLVGILGTTLSPYLFFWQASMEVEEVNLRKLVVDKSIIHHAEVDVNSGIFFSNLVFYFIILATGSVLFSAGVNKIDTVEDAAQALKPLAGEKAYLLFAIGVIGTGLLSIPVLAGSLSYMISEVFNWKEGLNKKFHEAKGFYLALMLSMGVAFLINFTGISPVHALIYTAVLYGTTAPVLIAIILHICNDKKIMGDYVNTRGANVIGFITLIAMTTAAVVLVYLLLI